LFWFTKPRQDLIYARLGGFLVTLCPVSTGWHVCGRRFIFGLKQLGALAGTIGNSSVLGQEKIIQVLGLTRQHRPLH
jgi:hypothetical protein